MSDWKWEDLLAGCQGTMAGGTFGEVTGFSIDSRTLKPGEVFFAICGENHDGHTFIPKAIGMGAAAIVASQWPGEKPADRHPAFIQVGDPLEALQHLARFHRERHRATFLGITGSNGKTTTKEMLAHLFARQSITWATAGNLNNHIGLPLNLVRMPLNTQTAIIEMGMNHAGEIRFLANIARPIAAVISNIGPAHIGNLGSLENIALAKAEILENLPENGTAVLNGDDPFFHLLKNRTRARVVRFGTGAGHDITGTDLQIGPRGIDLNVTWQGSTQPLHLKLLGKHNALNALAAMGVYLAQGGELKHAIERMSSFTPVSARMEALEVGGIRLILDCYNANPASMAQAVEYARICTGRRVVVLGDMRELGDGGPDLHRELGKKVAEAGLDQLVVVGELAQYIAEGALQHGMAPAAVHCCRDTTEASRVVYTVINKGDTVLLKASRGMHFEAIVKELWPTVKCELH